MTKNQLTKQLKILYKELTLVDNRLWKISQKLNIPENTDLKNLLKQVEQLIEIGESHVNSSDNLV